VEKFRRIKFANLKIIDKNSATTRTQGLWNNHMTFGPYSAESLIHDLHAT
jgi:hypothetical protein